uniref:Glycoside hydrolase family 31 TIM barrel domain-containing protein n=1 Tax=Timema cristinae TaxID=61476 RepID=A0A7R9CGI8_TIMCR|nr:unnamed protein product [Timema cristinae]
MEKSGNSHGVFLLNSNAMDVILQPTPAITFRTIGGILDLYFFLGPTPSDVVTQYTDVIGKPFMPPFWGLGFHLCRYGYKTLTETKEVWNRTRAAGIPLDVQWNDLDYMAHSSDFTYNQTTYAGLPQFVNLLHQVGMHYIPLIDPGISAAEPAGTYPPYDEGLKLGIFVKNSSGQPFIGKVWNPVDTVWPDFTHPKTVDYWLDQLKSMHDKFQFDGAWIDMNEPSNFWSGSTRGCENNSLDYPPYTPGVLGGKLFFRTLCMNSEQHAGKHYRRSQPVRFHRGHCDKLCDVRDKGEAAVCDLSLNVLWPRPLCGSLERGHCVHLVRHEEKYTRCVLELFAKLTNSHTL